MQNKLAEFRKAKGWSQEKLAEMAGITRVTISNIERGKTTNVKASTLVGIADALGTTVGSIFFGEEV